MKTLIKVDTKTYQQMSRIAGKNINKAAEQALLEWIERREAFTTDTFFKLKPVSTGIKDIALEIDTTLYGENE